MYKLHYRSIILLNIQFIIEVYYAYRVTKWLADEPNVAECPVQCHRVGCVNLSLTNASHDTHRQLDIS